MEITDLQDIFDEIVDIYANASTIFDVWSEMHDRTKQYIYEPGISSHWTYFQTCSASHITSTSCFIYSLLETKNNTYNIPGLRDAILEHFPEKEGEIDVIDTKISNLKPTWIKISQIRNQVFAHRSKKIEIPVLFKKLELEHEDINELLKELKELKEVIQSMASIAGITLTSRS